MKLRWMLASFLSCAVLLVGCVLGFSCGSALAAPVAVTPASAPAIDANARDFTFFFSSDPHIGCENPKAKPPVTKQLSADNARASVVKMLATIGQDYPELKTLKGNPPGKVSRPRGLLLAGDLTDNLEWSLFETVFPPTGLEDGNIPLFLSVGNHDGPPGGATREGVIASNRRHLAAKRIDSISDNGLHTAWKWDGVHFINVNLCPADTTDSNAPFKYGQPGSGSWNDPVGAFAFLSGYLRDHVGKGDPVIIIQHYGYCEGFNFDWTWWSPRQRRAFYDLIKDYNVVALLHGHTHAPAHYLWPQSKSPEMERLFGQTPPEKIKTYDVFSGGSVGGGTYYVFRVVGDRFIAAHRGPRGWSTDLSLHVVKPLLSRETATGK